MSPSHSKLPPQLLDLAHRSPRVPTTFSATRASRVFVRTVCFFVTFTTTQPSLWDLGSDSAFVLLRLLSLWPLPFTAFPTFPHHTAATCPRLPHFFQVSFFGTSSLCADVFDLHNTDNFSMSHPSAAVTVGDRSNPCTYQLEFDRLAKATVRSISSGCPERSDRVVPVH